MHTVCVQGLGIPMRAGIYSTCKQIITHCYFYVYIYIYIYHIRTKTYITRCMYIHVTYVLSVYLCANIKQVYNI